MSVGGAAAAGTNAEAPHLLVVDDDARIRSLLSRYLTGQGFRVTTAEDAAVARRHLDGLIFDLLIVDVMMPGESGVSFTRSVRQSLGVPVLMLTARAETEDRITGLEAGADDYLAKAFDPRELLLRVNAILRRVPAHEPARQDLRVGDLVLHLQRGEVRRGPETIRLTEREREMLALLAESPGRTVPRTAFVGEDNEISERAVDVQINRLRRKIERDPANPLVLQTVRGVGYRLVVD